MFGVWEPLLEPLEIEQSDNFRPWSLEVKVTFLQKPHCNRKLLQTMINWKMHYPILIYLKIMLN